MYWKSFTVPLCRALLLALLSDTAASEDQVVHPWTIYSDCPIPALPREHPVGEYQHHWLDLKDMVKLSSVFWLMFYGKVHNMDACGLRQGILYRVQRLKTNSFSYQQDDGDIPGKVCKDEMYLVLGEGSYGFISCAESRQKATHVAGLWWDALPTFYITTVLIGVGVAMGVVVAVGVVAGLVWRRRSRRNVGLT